MLFFVNTFDLGIIFPTHPMCAFFLLASMGLQAGAQSSACFWGAEIRTPSLFWKSTSRAHRHLQSKRTRGAWEGKNKPALLSSRGLRRGPGLELRWGSCRWRRGRMLGGSASSQPPAPLMGEERKVGDKLPRSQREIEILEVK